MGTEYSFFFSFYKYREYRLNSEHVSIEGKDIERGFHDNGKIQYEVPIVDAKWSGKLNAWDHKGILRIDTNFINGKEDGVHKSFFYNGQLKEETIFKEGKKDGISREWYLNGKQWHEVNYKDDLKHGISKVWNKHGKLEIEKEYINDSIHGLARKWDKKGNETTQFYWNNQEITEFNPNHAQIISAFLENLGYKIEAPLNNKKVEMNKSLQNGK